MRSVYFALPSPSRERDIAELEDESFGAPFERATRSASRSAVVLKPGNRNISKMRSAGVANPYCCRSPYL